mmetsp:Transcript_105868/g.225965  ORF Transcript_105868/g.225965 Transcript_105868/m.225965 type:complete len:350 (-) Transcript_105868:129-1178(-)
MESLKTGLLATDQKDAGGNGSEQGICGNGCEHGACGGHGHSHSLGHTHGNGASRNSGCQTHTDIQYSLAQSVQWLNAHDPAECRSQGHLQWDLEEACCDHSVLNGSTNVLVLVRAKELITMSYVNTLLAITAVLYISVNIVCTILNSFDNDCDPNSPSCSRATTPQLFHNLEFWFTFIFNVIDLFALSYSPRKLSNQYSNPIILKLIVLVNVGMSFCSCLLVSINLKKFEVPSHELEYLNELTITIFDATILVNLVRGRSNESLWSCGENCVSVVAVSVAGCVATLQLGIYNCIGWTAGGEPRGEQAAHYLEFAFGIVSAGITFWFTMDNKMCAEKRLREIMYGNAYRA